MSGKIDLKRQHKDLYRAATDPALVEVPPLPYLMFDGSGDPNGPAYQEALGALYAVAYALKFASKGAGTDFVVMPLEGLWWSDDLAEFSMEDRAAWRWTAMIAQPGHVTEAMVAAAIETARGKKNPPGLDRVRFETYHEGLAAQVMHIGPYADEAPIIARLHAWIEAEGYTHHGAKHHHEIYLSDPRRVAPEKMKTIIRQPVVKS